MSFDQNSFFRQATMRICGSLDIQKSLQSCLHYFDSVIPITMIYLHLFEPSINAIRAVAMASKDGREKTFNLHYIPEDIMDLFESEWAAQHDPFLINDPESHEVIRAIAKTIPLKNLTLLILPLRLEGRRLGFLTLYKKGANQYTQNQANLLAMLNEPSSIALSNALKHQEVLKLKDKLADDNQYLHQELLRISGDEIIGADTGLKGVMEMVGQVASLNSPVLLLGETGTGKEVIANTIHYSSLRKEGPFIKVNCGAIPEGLLDSALFGHEKGAFTGATTQKRGRFERAHKGTIFLDEIGELPLPAQVRLLRVIQNKEIERVGGTTPIQVDVRIISATNRNLEEMVRSKQFREDLWFRLNVFPIMIPPLRQRKEDIPALVQYFVERKAREMKCHCMPVIASNAVNQLMDYHFPGNVRELENLVERALIQSQGQINANPLTFQHINVSQQDNGNPKLIQSNKPPISLDELFSKHIRTVLKQTKGKVGGEGGAAELLGINPNTLRSRMRKLGIPFGRKTSS